MKTVIVICLISFSFIITQAQTKLDMNLSGSCTFNGAPIPGSVYGFGSTQEAVKIVDKIVGQIGLKRNFEIMAGNVPNAAATIKAKDDGTLERYILYSQSFISHIINETNSYWAAIGIMAHEVAHHLNGHTLKGGSRPPTELEADEFAGFVLQKMGASLTDAQAMFNNETMYQPYDSETHPATSARLEAVAVGWQRSRELSGNTSSERETTQPRTKKRTDYEYEPPRNTNEPKYETKPRYETKPNYETNYVTANFGNIWVQHNVYNQGLLGMYIHASFTVNNMLGAQGQMIAYFSYPNGTKLKDYNGYYAATDGTVSAGTYFNPAYTSATFNDLYIFMPYNELHMSPGYHTLQFQLTLFSNSTGYPTAITNSGFTSFSLTQN